MTAKYQRPDEIEALLPWFANGRLGPLDRASVEQALEGRADLRLQLRLIEEDRAATIAVNETLTGPSPKSWDRIADIAAAEPRRPPIWLRMARALVIYGAPPALRYVAAAAAVVIAVETAVIVTMMPATTANNSYATASVEMAPMRGPMVLVAFSPDLKLSDLSAFLADMHGEIVGGPRGGFFKICFGSEPLDQAALDALLAKIRANPAVRIALASKG